MRNSKKSFVGIMVKNVGRGLAKALYNKGKEIYFTLPDVHEISEAYGWSKKTGGSFDSLRAYYIELYGEEPVYKYAMPLNK